MKKLEATYKKNMFSSGPTLEELRNKIVEKKKTDLSTKDHLTNAGDSDRYEKIRRKIVECDKPDDDEFFYVSKIVYTGPSRKTKQTTMKLQMASGNHNSFAMQNDENPQINQDTRSSNDSESSEKRRSIDMDSTF